jgi:hypothetical protein
MYRYRALFRSGLDARDVHDVRKAGAFSVPLGNTLFKERIEATLANQSSRETQPGAAFISGLKSSHH